MIWLRSLALALALFGTARPAAAELFDIPCEPGSYVTGFEGRAGHWIDQLKVVCSRWDAERAKFEPAVTIDKAAGNSEGGEPVRSDCPTGSLVTDITAMGFASWKGQLFLQFIQIECRVPRDPFVPTYGTYFGSDRPVQNASILARKMCRPGEAASGVEGVRDDKFITEIWLKCLPRPWPAAASKRIEMPTVPNRSDMRKGGGLIGAGGETQAPSQSPPGENAVTTNDTDVYRRVVKNNVVIFQRLDDDPAHFLPVGTVAPLLAKEGGWWKLDLTKIDFVKGEGWVAADQLKPSP